MSRQNHRTRAAAFFLSGLLALLSVSALQGTALADESRYLVPVGHTVGMKLFSEGVVVVGLAEVDTPTGKSAPGAACGLKVGDVIEEANGKEVESSEQFAAMLQCGGTVDLGVSREGQDLRLSACPAMGADGTYRLGAWIRDSMAGIGTVTFYDPATGVFGALGHGIVDCDTGQLMPLGDGTVMDASVKAVKRGGAGEPGELKGSFNLTENMGRLLANTEQGVFGIMEGCDFIQGDALEAAQRSQVHTGEAVIRCNVSGDTVEEYAVEILRILEGASAQNLLLQITDSRLISQTGGIVQGMSGSPIVQDGRLVGAVTHVMIDNPEKGYGILIQDMLSAANKIAETG